MTVTIPSFNVLQILEMLSVDIHPTSWNLQHWNGSSLKITFTWGESSTSSPDAAMTNVMKLKHKSPSTIRRDRDRLVKYQQKRYEICTIGKENRTTGPEEKVTEMENISSDSKMLSQSCKTPVATSWADILLKNLSSKPNHSSSENISRLDTTDQLEDLSVVHSTNRKAVSTTAIQRLQDHLGFLNGTETETGRSHHTTRVHTLPARRGIVSEPHKEFVMGTYVYSSNEPIAELCEDIRTGYSVKENIYLYTKDPSNRTLVPFKHVHGKFCEIPHSNSDELMFYFDTV